ncbi:MAG: hypothetical protein ACXWP1_07765, partial [Bdellovibrionota bacterium]
MKLGLSLLLVFLPSLANAESYHLASCSLARTSNGWRVAVAAGGASEAIRDVSVKVSQNVSSTGGFCALLRGTGDEESADVLLNAASGSGLSVNSACEFQGQVDHSLSSHKALSYGENESVEYPFAGEQWRAAVYFASSSEAENSGWYNGACARVAQAMNAAAGRTAA